MGTSQVIDRLQRELLMAEHVLDTEYSFDLAEPHYRQCLVLIQGALDCKNDFEQLRISNEPLAYLMHVLRWSKIQRWLESELANDPAAIATGAAHEKVLAAYQDDWPNKEFYKFS